MSGTCSLKQILSSQCRWDNLLVQPCEATAVSLAFGSRLGQEGHPTNSAGCQVQRKHLLIERRVLRSDLSTRLGGKSQGTPYLQPSGFTRLSWRQNERSRPRRDPTRYKTGPSQWSHEVKLVRAKTLGLQVIWFKPPMLCETPSIDKG